MAHFFYGVQSSVIPEGLATADRLWQCPLFHLPAVIKHSLTFRNRKKDYTFWRQFDDKSSTPFGVSLMISQVVTELPMYFAIHSCASKCNLTPNTFAAVTHQA